MLDDIINTFLPKGWFPYVTPGSKFTTIGGLIAADVHGKNHHKEEFRNFVEWFELIDSKGEIKNVQEKKIVTFLNGQLEEWV